MLFERRSWNVLWLAAWALFFAWCLYMKWEFENLPPLPWPLLPESPLTTGGF